MDIVEDFLHFQCQLFRTKVKNFFEISQVLYFCNLAKSNTSFETSSEYNLELQGSIRNLQNSPRFARCYPEMY